MRGKNIKRDRVTQEKKKRGKSFSLSEFRIVQVKNSAKCKKITFKYFFLILERKKRFANFVKEYEFREKWKICANSFLREETSKLVRVSFGV